MQHQQKLETMAFQAELDAGKDAGQAEADAISKQMELEKQAVELDAAKVKADSEKVKASAEVAKTVMGAMGGANENQSQF